MQFTSGSKVIVFKGVTPHPQFLRNPHHPHKHFLEHAMRGSTSKIVTNKNEEFEKLFPGKSTSITCMEANYNPFKKYIRNKGHFVWLKTNTAFPHEGIKR